MFSSYKTLSQFCLSAFLLLHSSLCAAPGKIVYAGKSIDLDEWIAIGPITDVRETTELELSFAQGGIQSSATGPVILGQRYKPRMLEMTGIIDFFKLYQIEKKVRQEEFTCFVETIIESSNEADVILMLGSDGLLKVWDNGEQIADSKKRRTFESYNLWIPTHLHRGNNRILVEVISPSASVGLIARIEESATSSIKYALFKDGTFLKELVVKSPSDAGAFVLGEESVEAYLPNKQLQIRVRPSSTPSSKEGLNNQGVYYASLKFDAVDYQEAFFSGSLETQSERLLSIAEQKTAPEDCKMQIDAYARRLKILFDEANVKASNREWQAKAIFAMDELKKLLDDDAAGFASVVSAPGLHLVGFKSKVDGQIFYYRIFIPSTRNTSVPALLMMPTATSANTPFIESSFVAHQFDAMQLGRICEKYGVAMIWVGYPCQPFGTPREFSLLGEVIEDAIMRFNIDTDRLHLLGTCRAGMTAAMAAERFTGRFKSVGLLDPIFRRFKNHPTDLCEFGSWQPYNVMLSNLDPLNRVNRLGDTSFFIIQDGAEEGHGSMADAEEFAEIARRANKEVDLVQFPSSLSHMRGWEEIIRRCSNCGQRPAVVGETKAASFKRAGDAINEVLAEKFIVVLPSVGEEAELAQARHLSEMFLDIWSNGFHSRCPTISDLEVTPELMDSANLVILGNSRTNNLWKRLQKDIPMTLSATRVDLGSKSIKCKNPWIQAVFNSPARPDRRLVFVGGEDLSLTPPPALDVGINGWYKVAVWERPAVLRPKVVYVENGTN